jgi:hypothetical protein
LLFHLRFAPLNTGRSRVEGAGIPDFGEVQQETDAITARPPLVATDQRRKKPLRELTGQNRVSGSFCDFDVQKVPDL